MLFKNNFYAFSKNFTDLKEYFSQYIVTPLIVTIIDLGSIHCHSYTKNTINRKFFRKAMKLNKRYWINVWPNG